MNSGRAVTGAVLAVMAALGVGAWAGPTTPATTSSAAAIPEVEEGLRAQMEAVGRTERLLVDKIAERKAQLRVRVRALYKLARAGQAGLWLDAGERRARVSWEAAARRVLRRDVDELGQFEAELAAARTARIRLQADRRAAAGVRRPESRSLTRPVPGPVIRRFGIWKDDDSGAQLSRRGVELRSRPDGEVVAIADGVVAWVGPLRGLDRAVVIDHPGFTSVAARLSSTGVAAGQPLTAGQVIGAAAGRRVYLEVRLPVGAGGLPIDPEPLLR